MSGLIEYNYPSTTEDDPALTTSAPAAYRTILIFKILDELRFPLPPLPEQRAIAHVLGTLDDKIELNRRMNATLEEMARALFKSWFVDFEPVRAKMEGRWRRGESLPGLPAEHYDLFPDRLVDSELGADPGGVGGAGAGGLLRCGKGIVLRGVRPFTKRCADA